MQVVPIWEMKDLRKVAFNNLVAYCVPLSRKLEECKIGLDEIDEISHAISMRLA